MTVHQYALRCCVLVHDFVTCIRPWENMDSQKHGMHSYHCWSYDRSLSVTEKLTASKWQTHIFPNSGSDLHTDYKSCQFSLKRQSSHSFSARNLPSPPSEWPQIVSRGSCCRSGPRAQRDPSSPARGARGARPCASLPCRMVRRRVPSGSGFPRGPGGASSSVLHIVGYWRQSWRPSWSQPSFLPWSSVRLSLFLLCNKFICTIFLDSTYMR